jgi:hypothetical protein
MKKVPLPIYPEITARQLDPAVETITAFYPTR